MRTAVESTKVASTRRLIAGYGLLVVAVLGVVSLVSRVSDYGDAVSTRKDFPIDYASARALRDGVDPSVLWSDQLIAKYAPPGASTLSNPSWHTPLHLLIVLPLSFLPFVVAGVLWGFISAGAIVAAAVLLGREFNVSRRTSILLGLGALALPLVQWDLWLGQINSLVLLFAAWSWVNLRRDRESLAGVLLGIAGAIKLFPIFLAVSVFRTHRRAALVAVATCASLVLVPLVVTGRLTSWIHLLTQTRSIYEASTENVSLIGFLSRLTSANPLLTVAVFAVGAWLAWRSDFWTAALVALVAWPIVWGHYYVLAVPWIASEAARIKGNGRLLVLTFGALIVAIARPTFASTFVLCAAVGFSHWISRSRGTVGAN
jgi:glycosyl transferase family 87